MKKFGAFMAICVLSVGFLFSQVKETQCEDGIDNDSDGKIDCADPNCKKDPVCSDGSEPSLPIGCFDGDVAKWDAGASEWICAQDSRGDLMVVDSLGTEVGIVASPGPRSVVNLNIEGYLFYLLISRIGYDGNSPSQHRLYFPDANCEGDPWIALPSDNHLWITPTVVVSAIAEGVPGNMVYFVEAGTAGEVSPVIQSELQHGGQCLNNDPPFNPVGNGAPATPIVDLDTLFEPPFSLVTAP